MNIWNTFPVITVFNWLFQRKPVTFFYLLVCLRKQVATVYINLRTQECHFLCGHFICPAYLSKDYLYLITDWKEISNHWLTQPLSGFTIGKSRFGGQTLWWLLLDFNYLLALGFDSDIMPLPKSNVDSLNIAPRIFLE